MEQVPGVTQKVNEYALRILNGEDADSVLEGADTFRSLVEAAVATYQEKKYGEIETKNTERETEPESVINNSIPAEQIQKREKEDSREIESLRIELLESAPVISVEEIERRKKMTGWPASYELAAIAAKKGVDLSGLSREEYAQYAIDNYLAIDDNQLRVQPWQRNEQSVEAIVSKGRELCATIDTAKEKEFARFSHTMMELANKNQQERYIAQGVRVLSGTKDSNSWLFFSINNGTNQSELDTHKSYFSLKDLNAFSPEQFVSFMRELQKRGYNGGVKIFQDLTEQGTRLNDQVVMHGYSQADAQMAIDIAKEFFVGNIQDTSVGKDSIIEGESKSYSQILAEKIKRDIQNKK